MRNLAEYNEDPAIWEPYSGHERYVTAWVYGVGSQGRARTGTKVHLVMQTVVIAAEDGAPRQVGDVVSSNAHCNRNGSFTGQVFNDLDTDAITCEKCLPRI